MDALHRQGVLHCRFVQFPPPRPRTLRVPTVCSLLLKLFSQVEHVVCQYFLRLVPALPRRMDSLKTGSGRSRNIQVHLAARNYVTTMP